MPVTRTSNLRIIAVAHLCVFWLACSPEDRHAVDPSRSKSAAAARAPDVDPNDLDDAFVSTEEDVMNRRYAAGIDLFSYDQGASLEVRGDRHVPSGSDAFTRSDISYASPKGGRVPAILLVPRGRGPFPALILQHGLPGTKDDTMATAHRYAASGVVTVSIDAPFARRGSQGLAEPVAFTRKDRRDQIQLIVDLQRAVDLLIRRSDVDAHRVAYFGVSYGGAMGGLLAGVERRIGSYVLAVGDGGLVEHFTAPPGEIGVLDQLSPRAQQRWLAAMEPIEPLYFVHHAAPSELLMQNALRDGAVPVEDALRYQMAASEPKETRWYDSGHFLPPEATCDAAAWLRDKLGFDGERALLGCGG